MAVTESWPEVSPGDSQFTLFDSSWRTSCHSKVCRLEIGRGKSLISSNVQNYRLAFSCILQAGVLVGLIALY